MPVSEEQKERKNQMRRLNRARKKQLISPEEPEEAKEEPEEAKEEPEEAKEEPQVPKEDAEVIRKRAIADKRRASLALARSKIKPKSQITRDKDIEIAQIKEENTRLKELAIKPVIPEVVAKKAVVRQRVKKRRIRTTYTTTYTTTFNGLFSKSELCGTTPKEIEREYAPAYDE